MWTSLFYIFFGLNADECNRIKTTWSYMSLYVFILSCSGTGRDQESLQKLGLERSSGQAGHHGTGRGQEGNWSGSRCPVPLSDVPKWFWLSVCKATTL